MLRGKKDLTSMAVPQNKTISAIVHKLLHREFISITVLINSKNGPHKIAYGMIFINAKNLHHVSSVIVSKGLVAHSTYGGAMRWSNCVNGSRSRRNRMPCFWRVRANTCRPFSRSDSVHQVMLRMRRGPWSTRSQFGTGKSGVCG